MTSPGLGVANEWSGGDVAHQEEVVEHRDWNEVNGDENSMDADDGTSRSPVEAASNCQSSADVTTAVDASAVDGADTPVDADARSPRHDDDHESKPGDMSERDYELLQMRKLVSEIISDHYKSSNWPFLDPVDV